MTIHDTSPINYNHLITTQPHSLRRVFISDLHLSSNEPALVQAFLALLTDLSTLPNLQELYILGDWFDAWVGDDAYLSLTADEMNKHWLTPVIKRLNQLTRNGCAIKVMHGNRDFIIGQKFCDLFGGSLIYEPYYISIAGAKYRLEHGDALCTDDKAYQRFRQVIRIRMVQKFLLARPLHKRLKLAETIRLKSAKGKSKKSQVIMDVNSEAVKKAMKNADILMHGHTHRPNAHIVEKNSTKIKTRYVLGDWRVIDPASSYEKVEAVIGVTLVENTLLQINKQLDNDEKINVNDEKFVLLNYKY